MDALEAIHPGELARIVEAEVRFYRDPTRQAKGENAGLAREIRRKFTPTAAKSWPSMNPNRGDGPASAAMQAEIEVDQLALAAIAEDATARSQAHVTAINSRVSNFYEGARDLWHRIGAALAPRLPRADSFAWAESEPPDAEEEALFDSSRGYVEQIGFYGKERSGRPTGRKGAQS